MRGRLFILGAFDPELEPIERLLRDSRYRSVSCHPIGIGTTEAAARTVKLLNGVKSPAECAVIFVGSAGKIGKLDHPRGVVNVLGSCFIDLALAEDKAYLPEKFDRTLAADQATAKKISAALTAANRPVEEGRVYTSPSITSNPEVAARYSACTQANYENLELFGIASACRLTDVAWNALCPLSNVIGPDAHLQWKESHAGCASTMADLLFEVVLPQVYF